MESKTPVTILQELLMKKHIVPTYNLVLNGVGTHEPVFKYEVSAADEKAIGSGKSKKEAKHNAAQQLLQAMKVVDSTVDVLSDDLLMMYMHRLSGPSTWHTLFLKDLLTGAERWILALFLGAHPAWAVSKMYKKTSPYEGILKENAVGELQDFCVTNQLKLPEYRLIRDEGLPHAKVFSWACTVSSFTTEATARTKKNAKHMAALGMLSKLKECLGDIIETRSADLTPHASPAQEYRFDEMDRALDEVIQRMPRNIRKLNSRGMLGLNLSDVCYALTEENMPDLAYLDSIKDHGSSWFDSQDKENFQHIFSKIVEEIECEYNLRQMDSSDEKIRVVVLTIESIPSWTFVGTGQTLEQASNSAFEEAVKFLVKMRA